MRYATSILISTLVGATLCGGVASAPNAPGVKPRLALFITVDQLRSDYLVRLEPLFESGLKVLLEESFVFTEAYHDHAQTSTGPGHAALATGRNPTVSGIVGNSWFDRSTGRVVNCVEDRDATVLGSSLAGRSPRNLIVDSIGDWFKDRWPESRVFGASRKDRGAIFFSGHSGDGAFWYDSSTGDFVTSDYYMGSYPSWMNAFRERRLPDRRFGSLWKAVPVSEAELTRAAILTSTFPHALGAFSFGPDSTFYSSFGGTPFMDDYLVDLAIHLIKGENLGGDEIVDLLALSFSALDSVGHDYGPNSREALDTLLRLDRSLGRLLAFLDERIGLEHVVVVLSADHGVMTVPEALPLLGLEGRRVDATDVACYQNSFQEVEAALGVDDWFLDDLYLNYATVGRRNLLRSVVERKVAESLASCPMIARVWTSAELTAPPSPGEDEYLRLYRNSYHPLRSPDLQIQLRPSTLASLGTGTTHGSPYAYDRHVAMLVRIPGVPGTKITEKARTVDLAPTLARILGISPPPDVQGTDWSLRLLPSSAD